MPLFVIQEKKGSMHGKMQPKYDAINTCPQTPYIIDKEFIV